MTKRFKYLIDVVGTCNLRCTTCPVGNFQRSDFSGALRTKGFMPVERFRHILDKIISESQERDHQPWVFLYNWGEPFLHPDFPELIKLLKERGIEYGVSSNLSSDIDFTPILDFPPEHFRISLSGSSQITYERNHKAGSLHLVKSNLYKLAHLIRKKRVELMPTIAYILFRDNLFEAFEFAKLSQELAFHFHPNLGYLMPLEKMLQLTFAQPSQEDRSTLERLLISPAELMAIGAFDTNRNCSLLADEIVINHDGSVAQCCAVYDPAYFVASDFLQTPLAELQKIREQASVCTTCSFLHLHNVGTPRTAHLVDLMMMKKQYDLGAQHLLYQTAPYVSSRTEFEALLQNPAIPSMLAQIEANAAQFRPA